MEWREWFEICPSASWPWGLYGIYRVRITNPDNVPISIPRIGGVDTEGILNIGRSGFSTSKSDRSLGQRLREFWCNNHSGAYTYNLAVEGLNRLPAFVGHRLWGSVHVLSDERIEQAEAAAIRDYFNRFLELPPYNAAFPGR